VYGASDAPLGAGSVKIPKPTPKTALFVTNGPPRLYRSAAKPEETLSLSAYLSHSRKIRQNPKNFIFCKPRVPPNYERKAPVPGPMASLWRGYRDAAGGLYLWYRVPRDPRHGDPGPGQDVAQQRLTRCGGSGRPMRHWAYGPPGREPCRKPTNACRPCACAGAVGAWYCVLTEWVHLLGSYRKAHRKTGPIPIQGTPQLRRRARSGLDEPRVRYGLRPLTCAHDMRRHVRRMRHMIGVTCVLCASQRVIGNYHNGER